MSAFTNQKLTNFSNGKVAMVFFLISLIINCLFGLWIGEKILLKYGVDRPANILMKYGSNKYKMIACIGFFN